MKIAKLSTCVHPTLHKFDTMHIFKPKCLFARKISKKKYIKVWCYLLIFYRLSKNKSYKTKSRRSRRARVISPYRYIIYITQHKTIHRWQQNSWYRSIPRTLHDACINQLELIEIVKCLTNQKMYVKALLQFHDW